MGLFAVTASISIAQINKFPAPVAIKLNTGNDVSDPLGLLEYDYEDDDSSIKAVDLRASVVVNMASAERSAFNLINQKRIERGLAPLAWSNELAAVARIHSQNMAEFRFFSHRGLDNKFVSDRADQLMRNKWRSIGENIAFNRGYDDPVEMAVELWLESPPHKRNMMDPNWKETAVGVAKAQDGSVYFTQVFLVRK